MNVLYYTYTQSIDHIERLSHLQDFGFVIFEWIREDFGFVIFKWSREDLCFVILEMFMYSLVSFLFFSEKLKFITTDHCFHFLFVSIL